jgi:DNA-binding transcriptional LysR family regulator
MDFRRLRHAMVLREEKTFVKAAAKLHITQPALSQSISRLEADVGLRLFDRDRSGVFLTAVGKTFMARAEELLHYAKGFEHDIKLIRGGMTGSLSFGIGPLPAACFLKDLLHQLVTGYPNLDIQAEVGYGDDLVKHLIAERVEFFIASHTFVRANRRIVVRPITRLPISLFARARHPIFATKKIKITDMRAYPLLAVKAPVKSQEFWAGILGLDPSDRFSGTVYCDDFLILKELALSSDALLLSPYAAVAKECASGRMRELKVATLRDANVEIVMASLAKRTLSPTAELVVQKLIELDSLKR